MIQGKILASFAFTLGLFLCLCIQPSNTKKCVPIPSKVSNSVNSRNKVLTVLSTWFTIMANKAHFNQISQIFQGRDFKDADLNTICSKDMIDLEARNVTGRLSLNSFGQMVVKRCNISNIAQVDCSKDDKINTARGAKASLKTVKPSYNILWVTKKCFLSMSCLPNDSQAWGFYCNAQQITSRVQDIVLKKLKDFGLAKDKDYLMPQYKKCKIGIGADLAITEKDLN